MTDQLSIDGKVEDPAVKLTERQRFALDLISDLGPIPDDELGAHMHERKGRHSAEVRCTFCGSDGRSIGKELRRKGLVKQRRSEGWYVPGRKSQRAPEGSGYNPATEPIPF